MRIISFLLFWSIVWKGLGQNLTDSPMNDAEMILVEGGNTKIGSNEGSDNEKPSFNTYIQSFWLDKNPVTVGQFRKFIKTTKYVTDAEKRGGAWVYDSIMQRWELMRGANWLYPKGIDYPMADNQEPVRQISWNDAKAYANWLGKRLPSEFEIEYASQQAQKLELTYLNGSLWQWCENWYAEYNETSYFKRKLNREKTLKGGNHPVGGVPYRVSMRFSALPDKSFFHTGFRCAKDLN